MLARSARRATESPAMPVENRGDYRSWARLDIYRNVKSDVDFSAGGHVDFGLMEARHFVPRHHAIVSRRHVREGESSVRGRSAEPRIPGHDDRRVHSGVDVTVHLHHAGTLENYRLGLSAWIETQVEGLRPRK